MFHIICAPPSWKQNGKQEEGFTFSALFPHGGQSHDKETTGPFFIRLQKRRVLRFPNSLYCYKLGNNQATLKGDARL